MSEPTRQGGMSTICLAIVADSPIIRLTEGRLRPGRDPKPGELYAFSQRSLELLHALAREQALPIIRSAAELRAARSSRPSVIVSSEGATSWRARSSGSTMPTSAGRCAIRNSRTTGPTSWATSRQNRPSTAA